MPGCPNCRTEALVERTDRSGVAYDACPKCRGLWLDSGELSRLLGRPAAEGLLDFTQGSRPCARCSKPMLRGGFINPILVVDRCAPCGALWLDEAELRVVRKLLGVTEASEAESARVPPPAADSAASNGDSRPPGAAEPFADGAHQGGATPFVESWQAHAGFWLVLGLGTLIYGWVQNSGWNRVTAAGGLAGPAPRHLLGIGLAMTLTGISFVFTQPDHASDGYMLILSSMLRRRRRRYGRRGSRDWFDSSY